MNWQQLFEMLDQMPDAPSREVEEAAGDLWMALNALPQDDLGARPPGPVEPPEPDDSGYIPIMGDA